MPMEELDPATVQSILSVNVMGPFLCSQEAIKIMKAQEPMGGRSALFQADQERRSSSQDHQQRIYLSLRSTGVLGSLHHVKTRHQCTDQMYLFG